MLKSIFIGIILSSLIVVGCGSSDSGADGENDGPKYFEITDSGKTYTMDDVKAAGLKGLKEFKTDAVDKKTGVAVTPGATQIVLGFF